MKSFLISSLLLAASVFTSALSSVLDSGLEGRQSGIDTAYTAGQCAASDDCTLAAAWWSDCQNAVVVGLPHDPSSPTRSCLCPLGRAIPAHVDWLSKFYNCVVCVDMSHGPIPGAPTYLVAADLARSYCKGADSTEGFVQKIKAVLNEKNFPLELPEATLKPSLGQVPRSENIVPRITLASPEHSTHTSSTPTAVFNSQFSTFSVVPFKSAVASFSSIDAASTGTCTHDNCFRQALRSEPAVMSFCATYTATHPTASSSFPSCLAACNESPVRVSSACSCLASRTTSISIAAPTTLHTITLEVPAEPTVAASSINELPVADANKWLSLPASDAVRACAESTSCHKANQYHDACMKISDNGEAWKCFCHKWTVGWRKNLDECTHCLESSLPKFTSNKEPLSTIALRYRDNFCAYTGPKDDAKIALVTAGAILTENYQSSVALFNMTVIDAPLHPKLNANARPVAGLRSVVVE